MMKDVLVLIAIMFLWTGINAQEGEVINKIVDSRPDHNVPKLKTCQKVSA